MSNIIETPLPPLPETQPDDETVPWSTRDVWLGLAGMVVLVAGLLTLFYFWKNEAFIQSIGLLALELVFVLPVGLIALWRKADLGSLGLRRFKPGSMALGCGYLVIGYVIILVHNLVLLALHMDTQGNEVSQLLSQMASPVWLFFVGIVVGPLVEEIAFRGFVFKGLQPRYGWQKAALISSLLFALAHLDLASLIPTFVLGYAFAVLYKQSKSIWPGILLHALVNTFGLVAAFWLQKVG